MILNGQMLFGTSKACPSGSSPKLSLPWERFFLRNVCAISYYWKSSDKIRTLNKGYRKITYRFMILLTLHTFQRFFLYGYLYGPVCGPCAGDFDFFEKIPVLENFQIPCVCVPCWGLWFFGEKSRCWRIFRFPVCVCVQSFFETVLEASVLETLKNLKRNPCVWALWCGVWRLWKFSKFPCVWALCCVETLKIFQVPLCVSPVVWCVETLNIF